MQASTRTVPKKISTIFFDRDGIINDVVMRGTVVGSPRKLDELTIRDDFNSFYQQISQLGLNLFVVSNQPDVARKDLSTDALNLMTEKIETHGTFKEIVYCTHDNDDHCECRKPKPGMILRLLHKYNLAADTALIVGDSHKDILAGSAAGIETVYLLGSYNATIRCEPNTVVSNLNELLHHYQLSVAP